VKFGDSCPTEFVALDMGPFLHNRVGNRKDNVSIAGHIQQFIGSNPELHGRSGLGANRAFSKARRSQETTRESSCRYSPRT
jgi:hypothetical protein